jgi:hypothetical protein
MNGKGGKGGGMGGDGGIFAVSAHPFRQGIRYSFIAPPLPRYSTVGTWLLAATGAIWVRSFPLAMHQCTVPKK